MEKGEGGKWGYKTGNKGREEQGVAQRGEKMRERETKGREEGK